MINEALGLASGDNDLNLDGVVNVVDVQRSPRFSGAGSGSTACAEPKFLKSMRH